MRKTKEISRLADAGLTGRAIARSLGSSSSTVADALARLNAAGLSWAQVQTMSETQLERRLYREAGHAATDPREPDWAHVCAELKRRYVTLQLLWSEYRREHPDGPLVWDRPLVNQPSDATGPWSVTSVRSAESSDHQVRRPALPGPLSWSFVNRLLPHTGVRQVSIK